MPDQPTVSGKIESELTSVTNKWLVALSGFLGVVLGLVGLLNWRYLTGELPRELVSQAGQLFTLVMLINFTTSFGIPMVVVQFARYRSENSANIFRLALKVTGISTFVTSVLVMYVSNAVGLLRLGSLPTGSVILVSLFASLFSISTVVDSRLFALGRYRTYCLRLLCIMVLRFALSFALSANVDVVTVFAVMIGAFWMTSLPLIPGLLQFDTVEIASSVKPTNRYLISFAMSNYVSYLALNCVVFLLPAVGVNFLGDSDYLTFFFAWSFVSAGFAAFQQFGSMMLPRLMSESSNVGRSSYCFTVVVLPICGLVILGWAALSFAPLELYEVLFKHDARQLRLITPRLWLGLISLGPFLGFQLELRRLLRLKLLVNISFLYATFLLFLIFFGARRGGIEDIASWWLVGNLLTVLPFLLGLHFVLKPDLNGVPTRPFFE
jgi:hypothetical protein